MRDPQLGTEVSLGCVRTGCLLLSGQTGMALNVDVKAFHDMLFGILLDLRDDDDTVSTALMCARLLLHERREVSLERVAAFVRRLCEAALRMQPHQAVAALFNVRALLHKYPKLSPLLDGDTMTATAYVDPPPFVHITTFVNVALCHSFCRCTAANGAPMMIM